MKALLIFSLIPVSATDAVEQKKLTKVISLSPFTTELLFTAGAGSHLIAVDDDSTFPEQARSLPKVASHNSINVEQILRLQPDLIVDGSGYHSSQHMQQLHSLGIPFYSVEIDRLTDIPKSLQKLGQLTDSSAAADKAAAEFMEQYQQLLQQYSDRKTVPVFIQIWTDPLMSVGQDNFINDALKLCGASNIFANTPGSFPQVSMESLLQENPQLILTFGDSSRINEMQSYWSRYTAIPAVAHNRFLIVPHALLATPSPRVIKGVRQLCQTIDTVRQNSP
ncbi:ABC transporter substrate-binding protein [Endozoicomonadaceae bacterium StTr2]